MSNKHTFNGWTESQAQTDARALRRVLNEDAVNLYLRTTTETDADEIHNLIEQAEFIEQQKLCNDIVAEMTPKLDRVRYAIAAAYTLPLTVEEQANTIAGEYEARFLQPVALPLSPFAMTAVNDYDAVPDEAMPVIDMDKIEPIEY